MKTHQYRTLKNITAGSFVISVAFILLGGFEVLPFLESFVGAVAAFLVGAGAMRIYQTR